MFALSCAPLDQRGSEIRRPNGEIALALGRYELSGPPHRAEDARVPTDLLDKLAQQCRFRSLTRSHAAAGEEQPPTAEQRGNVEAILPSGLRVASDASFDQFVDSGEQQL